MFSLIITIVAIAIVVVLIAATMYHGGDTLDEGKKQAEVARGLSELAQVKAALVTYNMKERQEATSLQDLVPHYLSSIPEGWGVSITDPAAAAALAAFETSRVLVGSEQDKKDICNQINAKLDIDPDKDGNPPACTDISPDFAGCCVMPTP